MQRKRLAALRVDISQGMAIAQQLPQFRAQVTDLEARLDGLKAILPEEKDFADLLRSLQTLAVQSNLTIKNFKPAPVVSKDLHAEWPINIGLDGTYHNLGLFYDRISRFSRIINIGNMAIKAKDKPDQNTSISVALRGHDVRADRAREDRAREKRWDRRAAGRAPGCCQARRQVMRTAVALLIVVAAVAASAQEKPAVQAPPQAPVVAAAQAPATPAAPAFVYNPEGRRDPFVSLVKRATEARTRQSKQPAAGGISGFLVSELTLKGIMQSRSDFVALVSGPDAKTYLVRVNDRLLDGAVRAITADTLVCLQDVNDPLSLTKQREVRMTLRAVTEAK